MNPELAIDLFKTTVLFALYIVAPFLGIAFYERAPRKVPVVLLTLVGEHLLGSAPTTPPAEATVTIGDVEVGTGKHAAPVGAAVRAAARVDALTEPMRRRRIRR